MRVYLTTTANRGTGFITHGDWADGLSFQCFPFGANQLVVVDGVGTVIQNWATRVGGMTQVTKEQVTTYLQNKLNDYKTRRAAELQAELDALPLKTIEVV